MTNMRTLRKVTYTAAIALLPVLECVSGANAYVVTTSCSETSAKVCQVEVKNRLRDEEPMGITMDTEILVSLTRKFSNNILIPQ